MQEHLHETEHLSRVRPAPPNMWGCANEICCATIWCTRALSNLTICQSQRCGGELEKKENNRNVYGKDCVVKANFVFIKLFWAELLMLFLLKLDLSCFDNDEIDSMGEAQEYLWDLFNLVLNL